MRIENRTKAFKWMVRFSMILNDPLPDSKVTLLFDAEHLTNGTRYRHRYTKILKYAVLNGVI